MPATPTAPLSALPKPRFGKGQVGRIAETEGVKRAGNSRTGRAGRRSMSRKPIQSTIVSTSGRADSSPNPRAKAGSLASTAAAAASRKARGRTVLFAMSGHVRSDGLKPAASPSADALRLCKGKSTPSIGFPVVSHRLAWPLARQRTRRTAASAAAASVGAEIERRQKAPLDLTYWDNSGRRRLRGQVQVMFWAGSLMSQVLQWTQFCALMTKRGSVFAASSP